MSIAEGADVSAGHEETVEPIRNDLRSASDVRETSARMLALLSLLQSRPDWPGPELAERLGVSDRTIRNDITRLRELGYPVDAVRGAAGPLPARCRARSCRRCCSTTRRRSRSPSGCGRAHGVAGIEESSGRALAKLEQVLPHRLRRRVGALARGDLAGPGEHRHQRRRTPRSTRTLLATLAAADPRPRARCGFDYTPAGDGELADRRRAVPPGQLAAAVVPRSRGSTGGGGRCGSTG